MARNPIGEAGIVAIGAGMIGTQNIREINLSGIRMGGSDGLFRVAQLIGIHEPLEWMDISAIPLGVQVGEKLLQNLQEHRNLVHLECRECGKQNMFQLYFTFIWFLL